jgi:thioredoxin-related protein
MENSSSKPFIRWIEITANIAIIVVAVAIVLVFTKNFFSGSKEQPRSIVAGVRLNQQPINWPASKKNLVLVLSTTCHFCKESSRFYEQLVKDCRNVHTRTIAFFPQPQDQAQAYLKSEGVDVDEVVRVDFHQLQIGGTPTLVLVDDHGTVQKVWLGKLNDMKEKEVVDQSCRG